MKDETMEVKKVLLQIGIPANLTGFDNIALAVNYINSHETPNDCKKISMTKEIYPVIAKDTNSTTSRVERTIRHAVEKGFDHFASDSAKIVSEIFGNAYSPDRGKPSNCEFLYALALYMKGRETDTSTAIEVENVKGEYPHEHN